MTDRSDRDCCHTTPDPRVARRFDREWAEYDDAEGFPRIVDVSAGLLDQLRDATLERPTVFEIGSGTGGVSVALLEMGAASVRGVDLSAASVDVATRRAAAGGYADISGFRVGEGQSVADETADWVILDRVLCCDGRATAVLDAAIGIARRRIAFTVPESRGWRGLLNRPMWAAETVWDLARGGCRGFVHDIRAFERSLDAAGFTLARSGRVGLWYVGVYDRA